jgi:hypothetical protein
LMRQQKIKLESVLLPRLMITVVSLWDWTLATPLLCPKPFVLEGLSLH